MLIFVLFLFALYALSIDYMTVLQIITYTPRIPIKIKLHIHPVRQMCQIGRLLHKILIICLQKILNTSKHISIFKFCFQVVNIIIIIVLVKQFRQPLIEQAKQNR